MSSLMALLLVLAAAQPQDAFLDALLDSMGGGGGGRGPEVQEMHIVGGPGGFPGGLSGEMHIMGGMPMGGEMHIMGGPLPIGRPKVGSLQGLQVGGSHNVQFPGGSMQIIQLGGGLRKGEELPLDAILQAFGGFVDPLALPLRPMSAVPTGMRGAPRARPRGQDPDTAMFEDVLSAMGLQPHPHAPAKPTVPPACRKDLALFCGAAQGLHCLAQHSADLSVQCQKHLKKSLPVVCGKALETCDTFTEGILPCLKRQDAAQPLAGDCGETYRAAVQTMDRVAAAVLPQAAQAGGLKVVDLASGLQRPLAGDGESYLQEFADFVSAVV